MRDILFKAKRLNGNTWVEGYYVEINNLHLIYYDNEYSNGYAEVDPETLCQLIQTDKVRVWENDIVRWEDDDIISVIRYDEENARFVLDDYGIKGCLMEYGWDEDAGGFGRLDTNGFDAFYSFGFEVIGNIFDNPELINR